MQNINLMRKTVCLILLLVFVASLWGQKVYLETGKTFSSFDYKNSNGNSLDNLHGSSHNYLKLGFHSVSFIQQLNYSVGVAINGYGARGSDQLLGNYFDWDVSCLGVDLVIDYELFKKRFETNNLSDFSLFLKTSVSPEFTVFGTQKINETVYNIRGIEQFKYPFLFVRGGGGISYSFTRIFTVYVQYIGGKGFPLKFGDPDDKEKLRIKGHNFGFGLLIDLPSQ
jgi:hypothetical protein